MKLRTTTLLQISCTIFFLVLSLCSCQESLQERAQREAKDYTRKYCPTPFINGISTDSLTYNISKKTFSYYCTFADKLDDQEIIDLNRDKITEVLAKSIKESTQMKPYIEEGCRFHYVCRSKKDKKVTLLEVSF